MLAQIGMRQETAGMRWWFDWNNTGKPVKQPPPHPTTIIVASSLPVLIRQYSAILCDLFRFLIISLQFDLSHSNSILYFSKPWNCQRNCDPLQQTVKTTIIHCWAFWTRIEFEMLILMKAIVCSRMPWIRSIFAIVFRGKLYKKKILYVLLEFTTIYSRINTLYSSIALNGPGTWSDTHWI